MSWLLLICVFGFIAEIYALNYSPFGTGVILSQGYNPCRLLLAFGGYRSTTRESQIWIDALKRDFFDRSGLGIDTYFAVSGPRDSLYNGREISNSKIVSYFVRNNNVCAGKHPLAIIIAHSSGGFVAGEFISLLGSSSSQLSNWRQKIVYYDLDGATSGYTSAASSLIVRYLVAAKNSRGLTSANYAILKSGNPSNNIVLNGDSSGCTAAWCLHMLLITTKPHFPNRWDILDVRGLTDPAHPVQTQYLRQTLSTLQSIAGGHASEAELDSADNEEAESMRKFPLHHRKGQHNNGGVSVSVSVN